MTLAPCPVHGTNYRALHEHNFRGIVTVIQEIITTLSGVGTSSFSMCPVGYTYNFEGVVRALEDLNLTASGVGTGGTSVLAGSGISVRPSGTFQIFDVNALGINGVNVVYSGQIITISGVNNTASAVVSGVAAGPGITIVASGGTSVISLNSTAEGTVDLHYVGSTAVYSGLTNQGASVTVSGSPSADYKTGSLWFDTNEGRLFVYASGAGVSSPGWYQTNAEAIALKSDTAPSGTGLNSPPRDGSIWFNTLMGNLFVYDIATSGWYETGSQRSVAYGAAAPAPSVQGAGWYDSGVSQLKVWNGSSWINA